MRTKIPRSHSSGTPFSKPTSPDEGGVDGMFLVSLLATEQASDPQRDHNGYVLTQGSDAQYDASIVKSVHRTMQVFEFFAELGRPVTATEMVLQLGIPQSSASMLLRSLETLGYLKFNRQGRTFEPTLRLSLLTNWQRSRTTVAVEFVRALEKLRVETGETVILAERYQHFVRYIHVQQNNDPEKIFYVPLGTLRPICTTAFGQAILASLSDRDVRSIVHAARADRTSTDFGLLLDDVLSALPMVRERGFAATSRTIDGLVTYQIAALVPGRAATESLAVGICSYGERLVPKRKAVVESILECIEAVARQMND